MIDLYKIDLPKGTANYPDHLNEKRKELLVRFKKAEISRGFRTRLVLVAETFRLFAEQEAFETALRTKALAVMIRDRNRKDG